MSDPGRTHRLVTIEQVVRAELPDTDDLPTLFEQWGLTNSAQEAFWVVALDNVAQLKTVTEVARGGFHEVMVNVPTVLSAVLAAQTDRFYVAHNHPSGPVDPTEWDVELTAHIMRAANVAGLHFEDHIITGPEGWYSFYDAGIITPAKEFGLRAAMRKRGAKKRG